MAGGLLMPDPPIDSTTPNRFHSPRRLAVASRSATDVRRPLITPMPADRREQAISVIADLLMVQLEHDAQIPHQDARCRGRVAGSGSKQEESREGCHLPAHLHRRGAPVVLT
jgi:hypothetical protein